MTRDWHPRRRVAKIAPAAKSLVWIEAGTPEYEAWRAHSAAKGQTIAEYAPAGRSKAGFWRRTRWPPDAATPPMSPEPPRPPAGPDG